MDNAEAHRFAREKGTSKVATRTVRGLAIPYMKLLYALKIEGAENIPDQGPVIVAPNHKSFWDAFFVAAATKRPIRFMGKSELFEGRAGRLLIRLGAFPVRRGSSDAEAIETARQILLDGGLLALFPEGTRVRDPTILGQPHKGAARLALETGRDGDPVRDHRHREAVRRAAAATGTGARLLRRADRADADRADSGGGRRARRRAPLAGGRAAARAAALASGRDRRRPRGARRRRGSRRQAAAQALIAGLALALACAAATSTAFLLKHRGAVLAPPVAIDHPLRSAAGLFHSRWFAIGWLVAVGAWGLHVGALALAPLSIVQAVLAGGLVFLAVFAERFFGLRLGRRQWIGFSSPPPDWRSSD